MEMDGPHPLKPNENITRQAWDFCAQGKSGIGKLRDTWERDNTKVLQKLDLTWKEGKHVAQNRKNLIDRIIEMDSPDMLGSQPNHPLIRL